MRKVFPVILGLWCITAASVLAGETSAGNETVFETPPLGSPAGPGTPQAVTSVRPVSRAASADPEPLPTMPADIHPPAVSIKAPPVERPTVYLGADLLLWWVKGAPLSAPLAVATDGSGNFQTALGNSTIDYGVLSGLRLDLGVWFDDFNNYGLETSFFCLERVTNHQGVTSDDNGVPTIGLSFASATPGQPGEYIQYMSEPGRFAGDILTTSSLSLWGAEVNGSVCLVRNGGFEFITLAGFRYLDLREKLSISSSSTDLFTGDFIVLDDAFWTRNEFYGGQIAARVNWTSGRFALSATAKLGLGATHQLAEIQGNSFLSSAGYFPGGFYAQPSNIGQQTGSQFTVLPAGEIKVGYEFFRWCRLFLGYEFLYWNNVIRPGNQLDRNINLTQSPILGNGQLAGPASPTSLLQRSDFWAQGMTIGLEFRF